jgi:hypothetical protein
MFQSRLEETLRLDTELEETLRLDKEAPVSLPASSRRPRTCSWASTERGCRR